MIEIKNITKTFNPGTVNESKAIDNLSLTLNEGDFITIIGSNGAGKSTLLNIISGSLEADSGLILLNGVDVSNLHEHKRAPYFGHVFQDHQKIVKRFIEQINIISAIFHNIFNQIAHHIFC